MTLQSSQQEGWRDKLVACCKTVSPAKQVAEEVRDGRGHQGTSCTGAVSQYSHFREVSLGKR